MKKAEAPVDTTETAEPKQIDIVRLFSKAFGIPLAGITLLEDNQNKPFINSLGLQCAWNNYPNVLRIKAIEYIQTYVKPGDSSMVRIGAAYLQETKGVTENLQPVMGESMIQEIGTATPSNLSAEFKDYPNEIALTRAMNRLLRRVLLPLLYRTFDENLSKFTPEEQSILLGAVQKSRFGTVTVEEIAGKSEGEDLPENFLTNEQMAQIKPFLERLALAENDEQMAVLKKEISEAKETMTAGQVAKLREIYILKMKELV